jgi:hypothetical protein
LDWKIQRATETDLLNGNTAAMTALAQEKKAIRDANNAAEAEVDAETDVAKLRHVDVSAW